MENKRRTSRAVHVGQVQIGGQAPVSVQSMTNTDTRDVEATVVQIHALEAAGCEVVRLAIPDREAASALKDILRQVNLPLVADIHFDYRLALEAIEQGVEGLRINPGNIGTREKIARVVHAASKRTLPIRIGVNAGSLEKDLLAKHGRACPEAMVESALRHVGILEDLGFREIILSIKSSDVRETFAANRLLAARCDYPLHLGITEAGFGEAGLVKSAVGIGSLLLSGIGDTIRVSLTEDPTREVSVGLSILQALGLKTGVEIISCPTCGRCEIDLQNLASRIEREVAGTTRPLKLAVMGCVVNGPGEARDADLGIAGGRGRGIIFRNGKVVATVEEEKLFERFMDELRSQLEGDI